MKTIQAFQESLENENPPALTLYLQSLWYDGKGDWERAHEIAQDISDPDGSWIHAYLHRKEGDHWNANYWYQRAEKVMPSISIDDEWIELVEEFLNRSTSRD